MESIDLRYVGIVVAASLFVLFWSRPALSRLWFRIQLARAERRKFQRDADEFVSNALKLYDLIERAVDIRSSDPNRESEAAAKLFFEAKSRPIRQRMCELLPLVMSDAITVEQAVASLCLHGRTWRAAVESQHTELVTALGELIRAKGGLEVTLRTFSMVAMQSSKTIELYWALHIYGLSEAGLAVRWNITELFGRCRHDFPQFWPRYEVWLVPVLERDWAKMEAREKRRRRYFSPEDYTPEYTSESPTP